MAALRKLNAQASSSVGRLSSGNRIQRAMEDVAGLSVSTKLSTELLTKRSQLLNLNQADSMLQVTSDALGQMQDLLQRMQALTVQSNSGTLTATERMFLNKEFQGLGKAVDRLITETNFNGVQLLQSIGTNFLETNTTIAESSQIVTRWTQQPTNNQRLRIQEFQFQFRNVANPNVNTHVQIGANINETLENLKAAIETYNVDGRFDGYRYSVDGQNFIIEDMAPGQTGRVFRLDEQGSNSRARFQTIVGQNIYTTGDGRYTTSLIEDNGALARMSVSVTGQSGSSLITTQQQTHAFTLLQVANETGGIANNQRLRIDDGFGGTIQFQFRTNANPNNHFHIQIGANNRETLQNAVDVLNRFTEVDPANATEARRFAFQNLEFERDGLNLVIRYATPGDSRDFRLANVAVTENIGGTVLTSGTLNNGVDSGVNTAGIANADFYGTIQGFTADYINPNQLRLNLTVGAANYTAVIDDTSFGSGNEYVYLASEDHGFLKIQFAGNQGQQVNSQSDADGFAKRLDQAFANLKFHQERSITNYVASGTMVGTSLSFQTSDFTKNIAISAIDVTAASENNGTARIRLTTSNGDEYVWEDVGDGVTEIEGGEIIRIRNLRDSNEFFTFNHGSTEFALATSADAARFAADFLGALPNSTSSGVTVTVPDSKDNFVELSYTGFLDNQHFSARGLDISTQSSAAQAFNGISTFISEVTAQRAQVGALQSRVGVMAAQKENDIRNVDFARSVISDTDIAGESTAFALTQVKQQSNIAAISQINGMQSSALDLLAEGALPTTFF